MGMEDRVGRGWSTHPSPLAQRQRQRQRQGQRRRSATFNTVGVGVEKVGGCDWEVGREGEKAEVSSVHDTVALAMWMSGMPGVYMYVCARASLSRSLSLSLSLHAYVS